MCGIAGLLRFPQADPEPVFRMMQSLAHRGPDGEGIHADGPVVLGHRRLAIIDLEGGRQPLFNEDQSIAVVFNGEIYNYQELAQDLRKTHQLRTVSDTEVLVHLYEDHGPAMLSRLRGMFAFALWDGRTRTLLLARDRWGKKPIYYAHDHGTFVFASELGALRASRLSQGSIDPQALHAYLKYLYIPAPKAIWKGVSKLPAGHLLLVDEQGARLQRYWAPPVVDSLPTPPDLEHSLLDALKQAVELRLRSDVPLGVLLSGGVDSSAVTALAAQASGTPLRTFSVGFGQSDDELPFARLVAERYATEHTEIVLDGDVRSATERAFDAFSEPFGDSSSVPMVAVFREISRSVKVVLTGDGGDEVFGGYDSYRTVQALPHVPAAQWLVRLIDQLGVEHRTRGLRRRLLALATRGMERSEALLEVFSAPSRARLLGNEVSAVRPAQEMVGDVQAALAFDLSVYLPDDLLVKTDISSMHWGVEARCPLLDQVVSEFAVPLPLSTKLGRHEGKILLKRALRELLPPAVLSRPKRGFGSPVANWLAGPLRELVGDLLLTPRISSWMDERWVRRVAEDALERRGNAHQAWALLALEAWARRHSDLEP